MAAGFLLHLRLCYLVRPWFRLSEGTWSCIDGGSFSQAAETETEHAPAEVAATAGSGGAGSTKKCLCSPTRHPGSFRCRHHRSDYVWGGRVTKRKQLLERSDFLTLGYVDKRLVKQQA
ncbi:hypothetical protein OIU84_000534 [Salix udensis]|uniref:Uncharacterized protein n=1 Tax=Salix udensis TaxID=889485 RepID=A0AAD6PMG6_9ROSI|nr:hypothetical protein OIU84_000534 [Salix udensis]